MGERGREGGRAWGISQQSPKFPGSLSLPSIISIIGTSSHEGHGGWLQKIVHKKSLGANDINSGTLLSAFMDISSTRCTSKHPCRMLPR